MKKASSIPNKIPLLDINQAGFHEYHGNQCEIEMQGTTAFFMFVSDSKFYELAARYGSDEPIPALSFARILRQLRSRMYTTKKANENGRTK